jgi:hypothetical protein
MGTFREGNWLALADGWQQWSRFPSLSITALKVSQYCCWPFGCCLLGQSIFGWAWLVGNTAAVWGTDGFFTIREEEEEEDIEICK